jgi:hypothetical protein
MGWQGKGMITWYGMAGMQGRRGVCCFGYNGSQRHPRSVLKFSTNLQQTADAVCRRIRNQKWTGKRDNNTVSDGCEAGALRSCIAVCAGCRLQANVTSRRRDRKCADKAAYHVCLPPLSSLTSCTQRLRNPAARRVECQWVRWATTTRTRHAQRWLL